MTPDRLRFEKEAQNIVAGWIEHDKVADISIWGHADLTEAIAEALTRTRREAIEECAKVAEGAPAQDDFNEHCPACACEYVADHLRALASNGEAP